MADRIGEWMCTFTGLRMWPLDPRPEDICLEDIAHHLAQENRFNGALPQPYSVAQHSVLVSHIVERVLGGTEMQQKLALFHDAPEAYAKDIHRPLKRAIREVYDPIESRIWLAIAEKFGLDHAGVVSPIVKDADALALALERRDLFPSSHQQLWTLPSLKHFPMWDLGFLDWRDAERVFLQRFRALFGGGHG